MDVDVAIIGAGPAGTQAGMHAARKKVSVMIIGRPENSAIQGTHIENHFGAPGKADGTEMLLEGLEKAKAFGCSLIAENVTSIEKNEKFILRTESDQEISAKAVIIASGIHRNKLGVSGEKELLGKGVSYCASCDCNFYKGKIVAIVGDESEAAASAELMTKYASKTYWIINEPKVSDVMIDKAKNAGAEVIEGSLESINGKDKVTSIRLNDGLEITTDGVFIELGGRSSADLAMDLDIMPDTEGLIKVDADCRTSAGGVFACGDVTGKPWQIAKAVGQGAVAGLNAAEFVKGE